ncbi:MAG: hypothetical protein AAFY41_03255, partial [Bacteroidota bacterium]
MKKFKFSRRFSVAKKIALSSFIVILLAAISGIYSLVTLRGSRSIDDRLTEHYYPLISDLKEYEDLVASTNSLATNWMYLPNLEDKAALNKIQSEIYPELKESIYSHLVILSEEDSSMINQALSEYDAVTPNIQKLKEGLSTEESYQDDFLLFELIPLLDDEISVPLKTLQSDVSNLIANLEETSEKVIQEKFES